MTRFNALRLFAIGFSVFAVGGALAQPVISGSYYEEFSNRQCTSTNTCEIVFTKIQQNILITDVACSFTSSQPLTGGYMAVSDTGIAGNGAGTRRQTFFPINYSTTDRGSIYSRSLFQTKFLFGATRWPSIVVESPLTNTTILTQCKIVGTIQPN